MLWRVVCLFAVTSAAAFVGCTGSATTAPTPTPSGATVGTPIPNEGWVHVAEGSAITYQHNPPASGPHYPVWLRYQEFPGVIARGYWVHNLEHGAIVFLYRPDAPAATVTALRDVFRGLPNDPQCGHPRALMLQDPLMPHAEAVVAADWLLDGETVDAQMIRDFVLQHRNHAPENICEGGDRP
jgi:Protein of unknown function (DUF3105)